MGKHTPCFGKNPGSVNFFEKCPRGLMRSAIESRKIHTLVRALDLFFQPDAQARNEKNSLTLQTEAEFSCKTSLARRVDVRIFAGRGGYLSLGSPDAKRTPENTISPKEFVTAVAALDMLKAPRSYSYRGVDSKPKHLSTEGRTKMIRTRYLCTALALAFWASGPIRAGDDPPKDKQQKKATEAPEERYQAILKEYNEALDSCRKDRESAKTKEELRKAFEKYPQPAKYFDKFLKLAEENPKTNVAFDALMWIGTKGFTGRSEAKKRRTTCA